MFSLGKELFFVPVILMIKCLTDRFTFFSKLSQPFSDIYWSNFRSDADIFTELVKGTLKSLKKTLIIFYQSSFSTFKVLIQKTITTVVASSTC